MDQKKKTDIFRPITKKARYKILKGGRGSGKSWKVARALTEISRMGQFRFLCARELQNSISDSVIQLLSDTIERQGYRSEFEVQRNRIYNRITGSEFMFYGIKNNPTKIKSLEGIDICWIEEAEAVSDESWNILIPTIRKEHSEIWLTFNPKNILDATYQRFVVNPPKSSILITANYYDNPHFPETLRLEMEECKERDYQLYRHVWLGEPVADSEKAFIKPEWLEACIDAHSKLNFEIAGERVIGYDVADDGADKNATILRNGSVALDCDEWTGQDVIESTNRVNMQVIRDKADKVIYDSIGVGAGVKAQFRVLKGVTALPFNAGAGVFMPEAKYTENKKNKDMFSNLKAQAWQSVADRCFKTYRAVVHGDDYPVDQLISISSKMKDYEYLVAELSRPQIDYDQNGRVKVESKKDLKKRGIPSPNKADAFIMAFATPVIKRELRINHNFMAGI